MVISESFDFIEPTTKRPFIMGIQLDGNSYTLRVIWNIYGNRYYIHIYDNGKKLALCTPMVSGGNNYPINLSGRAFSDKIYYNKDVKKIQISR